MKKTALTLIELLLAMTMVSFLGLLSIRGLIIYLKEDTNLFKFKPVLGSVSEVVFQLVNDETMYGTQKGFADTRSGQYLGEAKVFGGKEKFRKLFKSKFNVLDSFVPKDDPKFGVGSSKSYSGIGDVPVYKYTKWALDPDANWKLYELVRFVDFSDLHCFTENKGITFCLYDTCSDNVSDEDTCTEENMIELYIRAYLKPIDKANSSTFDNSKAIYFAISNDGKVSVPPIVPPIGDTPSNYIINCGLASGGYSNYAHCKVRNRVSDVNVIVDEEALRDIKNNKQQ